jgi:O-antigen/teichoic acid export membrane protein
MTSEIFDQDLGSARIKRVVLGGATAFAIFIASAGVTAGSQLLIARLIGAETYGVYAYVIAWMTILAYLSALGFDIALLRFVSVYHPGSFRRSSGIRFSLDSFLYQSGRCCGYAARSFVRSAAWRWR